MSAAAKEWAMFLALIVLMGIALAGLITFVILLIRWELGKGKGRSRPE